MSDGWFTISQVYSSLGITSTAGKTNIRMLMHRLIDEEVLVKSTEKNGVYRKKEVESTPIPWAQADTTPMDITLPLGLADLGIKIYPSNVIVVAGDPNSGKTSLLLNFVKDNMDKYDIHYFSSEMMAGEFRNRISKFNIPQDQWRFSAWERSARLCRCHHSQCDQHH